MCLGNSRKAAVLWGVKGLTASSKQITRELRSTWQMLGVELKVSYFKIKEAC